MKTQAITLSDETYRLLGEFAADQGQPISYIMEESLWGNPLFAAFAREQDVEKPIRGKPGKPRAKKEA